MNIKLVTILGILVLALVIAGPYMRGDAAKLRDKKRRKDDIVQTINEHNAKSGFSPSALFSGESGGLFGNTQKEAAPAQYMPGKMNLPSKTPANNPVETGGTPTTNSTASVPSAPPSQPEGYYPPPPEN